LLAVARRAEFFIPNHGERRAAVLSAGGRPGTEYDGGKMVTHEGDVVWEYVNPYFGARQRLVVNAVQRAYRYTAEEIAKARAAT
jgi:hypothetical protein